MRVLRFILAQVLSFSCQITVVLFTSISMFLGHTDFRPKRFVNVKTSYSIRSFGFIG